MSVCGRFAPSPTGDLHLGSLVAAVGSWLSARRQGGRWLLRIDDIDPPREVAGASARMIDTLGRFGLHSDAPVLFQSSRRAAYQQAFETLRRDQHLFPCWCSRQALAADGGMHRDGQCRQGPQTDRPPAWRARVPDEILYFEDAALGPQRIDLRQDIGDFVVRRVEGLDSYQLATVVDDAWQGVSEVVRGADLLSSTPRQIVLQRWLGLPQPRYRHLPIVLDQDGQKLSKSSAAPALDSGAIRAQLLACLRHLDQLPAPPWPSEPEALLAAAAALRPPRPDRGESGQRA